MVAVDKRIVNILNAAQGSLSLHAKLAKELQYVQSECGSEAFQASLQHLLSYSLVVTKREPAVERTIDFIAKFATGINKSSEDELKPPTDEDEDLEMKPILFNLFNFLLDHHDVQNRGVRFRVCQMVGKLLHFMGDDDAIDGDLGDRIFEAMMMRLKDKYPNVRTQAVIALARLQDPTDSACPVLKCYIHLMANDSSPDVRRACVAYTAVTSKTLEAILERTRDTNDSVRKTAYQVLGEKVNIKALTIAQRLQILQDGLNDRAPSIKLACVNMVKQKWVPSLDSSTYNLLGCLHVESSPDIVDQTLKTIFQDLSEDQLKVDISLLRSLSEANAPYIKLQEGNLNPEAVIYWKALCQHIFKCGDLYQGLQDELLPEPIIFCDYVLRFAVSNLDSMIKQHDSELELVSSSEFVFRQLLLLVEELDLSDEVGRKSIQVLVKKCLLAEGLPSALIEQLIKIFRKTVQEEDKFVQDLVEVISDIRQPMVEADSLISAEDRRALEVQIGKVKVRVHEEMELLEKALAEERYQDAAGVKERMKELEDEKAQLTNSLNQSVENQSIRQEKDDIPTIHKCLIIAAVTLKSITIKKMTPTIKTLVQTLVWPAVQNEDPLVREGAVHCLGLCSLLDKDFAAQHLVLFVQVSQIDHEVVQLRALQILFDLLLVYGLDAFNVEMHSEIDATSLEKTMSQIHEKEETDYHEKEDLQETVDVAMNSDSDSMNSAKSVLSILTAFFDSESAELRTVVVEGMAKLLLAGRIQSAKLFSRLILLWYNPAVCDDLRLRHCVGVFLPMFAFAARSHQEVIAEAFLPIVETLFNAPDTSPLSAVNVNNVIELLVHLTNSTMLQNKGRERNEALLAERNLHESLAEKVTNEILSDVSRPQTKTLCRVLTLLDVSKASTETGTELLILADRLLEVLDDAGARKHVEKFKKALNTLKAQHGDEQEASNIDCNGSASDMNNTTPASLPSKSIEDTTAENTKEEGESEEAPVNAVGLSTQEECSSYKTEEDPCTPRAIKLAKSKQDSQKRTAKKRDSTKTVKQSLLSSKSTVRTRSRKGTRVSRFISDSEDDEELEEMMADPVPPISSVQKRAGSARTAKNLAMEKTKMNLESMLDDDSCDDELE